MRNQLTVTIIAIVFTAPLLAGCGGTAVYKGEAFKEESPYRRNLNVSAQKACEAAQLAMLSQAYRISHNEATEIRGQKDFQPDDDIT